MHEPTRAKSFWQTPPAELVEWARPAGTTEGQASRRGAAARRASRRTLLRRHRTTPARS